MAECNSLIALSATCLKIDFLLYPDKRYIKSCLNFCAETMNLVVSDVSKLLENLLINDLIKALRVEILVDHTFPADVEVILESAKLVTTAEVATEVSMLYPTSP